MALTHAVTCSKTSDTAKLCRNWNSEGRKNTLDTLFDELKCITRGASKEEFNLIISSLEEKLSQYSVSKQLVMIVLQEKLAMHFDSTSSESECQSNESAEKSKLLDSRESASELFSVKNNELHKSVPEELKEVVAGAPSADKKRLENIISALSEKLIEFRSIIQFMIQQRDEQTVVAVSGDVPMISTDALDKMIPLDDCNTRVNELNEANKEVSFLPSEVDSSYSDLKVETISNVRQRSDAASDILEKMKVLLGVNSNAAGLLEAASNMQNSFLQEQQKNDFNKKILEEKDIEYQKLLSEKNVLLSEVEEVQKVNQQLREDIVSERMTSKIIVKKIKKDRDSTIKKLRRSVDEAQAEYKNLSEKMKDITAKPENLADIAQSSVRDSTESFDAKIINGTVEDNSESLQKRYEDICQQLETSEKSLEVQQELNAKITKTSAESRARHTIEITEREEIIQNLKANLEKQNGELLRIKELERRKTDVLVNLLEDEKQKIRDECDSLKVQLAAATNKLKEQKVESKRQLEAELWKMKKAFKAAEKQKASVDGSTNSPDKVSEIELKLDAEIQAGTQLRKYLEELETRLVDITSNLELKDKALDELAKLFDEKDQACREATEKFEDLQRGLLENLEQEETTANRLKELDERERELEEMRVEYEAASIDIMRHSLNTDIEKSEISDELNLLRGYFMERNEEFDAVCEEKAQLEEELKLMKKNLDDMLSPRKDKISQLESRLEVVQTSAKAQQKRLEDDLSNVRAEFDLSLKTNEELSKQIDSLQQKSLLAEDMIMTLTTHSLEAHDYKNSIKELQNSLSELQEKHNGLQAENAQERADLVNELIVTKGKLKELLETTEEKESNVQEIKKLEDELKSAKSELEEYQNRSVIACSTEQIDAHQQPNHIDEMFPHLNPEFRQFVEILLKNQNVMYGFIGLFVYALLIHLYILL